MKEGDQTLESSPQENDPFRAGGWDERADAPPNGIAVSEPVRNPGASRWERAGAMLYPRRGLVMGLCFLFLTTARLASGKGKSPSRPGSRIVLRLGLGWLAVIAAAALRLWAGRHIGSHSRGKTAAASATGNKRWAQTGPYAYCRHPLYTANALGGIGCAALSGVSLQASLPVLAALGMHHQALVRHEEAVARAADPVGFAAYRDRVSRWPNPGHPLFRRKLRQAFARAFSAGRTVIIPGPTEGGAPKPPRVEGGGQGREVLVLLLAAVALGWWDAGLRHLRPGRR